MILKVNIVNMKKYRHYFNDYPYTINLLDTMMYLDIGTLFVDNYDNPSILKYTLPYINLISGSSLSEHLEALFHSIPEKHAIILPPGKDWKEKLRIIGEEAYILSQEPN